MSQISCTKRPPRNAPLHTKTIFLAAHRQNMAELGECLSVLRRSTAERCLNRDFPGHRDRPCVGVIPFGGGDRNVMTLRTTRRFLVFSCPRCSPVIQKRKCRFALDSFRRSGVRCHKIRSNRGPDPRYVRIFCCDSIRQGAGPPSR